MKRIDSRDLKRIQTRLDNKGIGYKVNQGLNVLVFNPMKLGEKRGNILLNDLQAYFKISDYQVDCPKYQ